MRGFYEGASSVKLSQNLLWKILFLGVGFQLFHFSPFTQNKQHCQLNKVHNLQSQMGNVNREMEILRKNQKEMLEIKAL